MCKTLFFLQVWSKVICEECLLSLFIRGVLADSAAGQSQFFSCGFHTTVSSTRATQEQPNHRLKRVVVVRIKQHFHSNNEPFFETPCSFLSELQKQMKLEFLKNLLPEVCGKSHSLQQRSAAGLSWYQRYWGVPNISDVFLCAHGQIYSRSSC